MAKKMTTRQLVKTPIVDAPEIDHDMPMDDDDDDNEETVEDITNEELDRLIEEAESLSDTEVTVRVCRATDDLLYALGQRMHRNRYRTASWCSELTRRMLTPLADNRGKPVIGQTLWDLSYLPRCDMDSNYDVHNMQHTIFARNTAKKLVRENIRAVKAGEKVAVNYADLGITLELLDSMHILLVQGMNPEAADKIDTAKQRDVSDVLYRHNLFENCDYSLLFGGTPEQLEKDKAKNEERTRGWQNREADLLAQVLRFLNYRFCCNGASPRGSASKFEHSAAIAGVKDYPGTIDSVHSVWYEIEVLNKRPGGNKKKAGSTAVKASRIPIGYAMLAHYLATMSTAKKQKDGSWKSTDEARWLADDFVFGMLFGGNISPVPGKDDEVHYDELLSGHKLAMQVKSAIMSQSEDAHGKPIAHAFSRDNQGLTKLWNAIGWAWRDFAGLDIPENVTISTICTGKAGEPGLHGFSRYSDGKGSFDVLPTKEAEADATRSPSDIISADAATIPVATGRGRRRLVAE